ncbi:MAG TPA: LacI family DNA-binding transcriptional regulator [Bacteroidales bacterium]|nr:LacI family DNA-binding transcriptional regulator [Bacteroidales bacterium]
MRNNREITIYDLAKALDLSPSTVSRGLKDHPHIRKETARKIKAVADEMGYQRNTFASNLRAKHTNTIGLVVPRLNSYFMASVISGIEKVTNEQGYGLVISTSQESAEREISSIYTLYNSRVDGLLVSLAYDTGELDHFRMLLNRDIPVVFFDRVSECSGCIKVVIDNFKAGLDATTHLVEQGCRNIVHLGGNLSRNVYEDRYKGYRKALTESGIAFSKKLVLISDLSVDSAREAARQILRMKTMPDGLFASNDASAVAVIMEMQKHGIKVPEDICIAGFNNEPVSQVIKPNLTTVDYPAQEIGEIAALSLINRLRGNHMEDRNTILLDHKLIIRESTLRKTQTNKSEKTAE